MSNRRLSFQTAIAQNPQDDDLRLIFADWLEEHDDPLGPFIRVQMERHRLGEPRLRWPAGSGDNSWCLLRSVGSGYYIEHCPYKTLLPKVGRRYDVSRYSHHTHKSTLMPGLLVETVFRDPQYAEDDADPEVGWVARWKRDEQSVPFDHKRYKQLLREQQRLLCTHVHNWLPLPGLAVDIRDSVVKVRPTDDLSYYTCTFRRGFVEEMGNLFASWWFGQGDILLGKYPLRKIHYRDDHLNAWRYLDNDAQVVHWCRAGVWHDALLEDLGLKIGDQITPAILKHEWPHLEFVEMVAGEWPVGDKSMAESILEGQL